MSGTAVAATIGKEIVRPEIINVETVGAAMVGVILWSTVAWYFGLPTSETHALVSGLTGAGLAAVGRSADLGRLEKGADRPRLLQLSRIPGRTDAR
jgi:PiT family inorganic phosphate transporter